MTEINPQTPIPQEIIALANKIANEVCPHEIYGLTKEDQENSAGHLEYMEGAESGVIGYYLHLLHSAVPSTGTFFFSQDDSCHWYMIPTERREEWSKARDLDLETDEGYEEWQKGNWEDYMTGGGIGDIDFIPSPPTPGA